MKKNELTLHINCDRELISRFDRLYPHCRKRFVENAIKLATNNREIFDKIFFCDILKSVDGSDF